MISGEVFFYIVTAWTVLAIVLLPLLLRVTAPYGRHSSTRWGPMMDNRLGWFLMELPALLVFGWFALAEAGSKSFMLLFIAALWLLHYTNRVIVFPLRIRSRKKKIPLAIVAMAFFFNLVNGSVNGYWLGSLSLGYPESWVFDPRFVLGILLFLAGFVMNQYADSRLIALRKGGVTTYSIPKGGLFDYVSCPNLFGELIEWAGFALLSWNLASLSFFVWTAVNLIPRALDHHRWYHQQFSDYPKNRKAIIPFVV